MKENLSRIAAEVDARFPDNECLRIEDGELILGRLVKRQEPKELKALEQLIAERIEHVDILGVRVDTENWLNWTRFFGPISRHESKIDGSPARYVATAFCYGCKLGASQTSRSLGTIDVLANSHGRGTLMALSGFRNRSCLLDRARIYRHAERDRP
jgi:hypothetical protein